MSVGNRVMSTRTFSIYDECRQEVKSHTLRSPGIEKTNGFRYDDKRCIFKRG